MLKRITLKNFEGHRDTTIDLCDGVNIIAGESNAGKSSIFRALRLVFLNEPGGEDFISFDEQTCEVTVEYGTHIIKRIKSRNNKANEYVLDGQSFKAFGQSVPDEIKEVLGLNEINFEWQFDKRPFLISETGGYIASKLNEIVNLELIDKSLKNVDSMKRKSTKTNDELRQHMTNLENQIKSYNWVEEIEDVLLHTEARQATYSALVDKNNKLHALIEELQHIQDFLQKNKSLSSDSIAEMKRSVSNYKEVRIRRDSALNLKYDYLDSTKRLDRLTTIDDSEVKTLVVELDKHIAKKIEQERLNDWIEQLMNLDNRYEQIIGRMLSERRFEKLKDSYVEYEKMNTDKLGAMIEDYYTYTLRAKRFAKEIDFLHNEYKSIAPDICPLCGSEFKKELK